MKKYQSKKFVLIILVLSLLFVLTGCMPGDGKYTQDKPANFLSGIWHGWIAPISLIVSIGNKNIRIYESMNIGFWYDFAFYMAIISGFGGISLSRKKKK